jgi:MFS family permease
MLREDSFAYGISLLVIFVDAMGVQFTAPVLVPYAISLGITIEQVGYLYTVQFIGEILCNLMMPRLSDAKGRTIVVYLSMIGSTVAYLLLGITYEMETDDAFAWLVSGKFMSGLFGGTFPIMLAYIADLTIFKPPHVSKEESQLLRLRTTTAGAMLFTIPIALAPIGGAVATFGLHLPFLVAAAVAFCGLLMSLRFMEEASAIKQRASKKNDPSYQALSTTNTDSDGKVSETATASDTAATSDGPNATPNSVVVVPTEPSASETDDKKSSESAPATPAPSTVSDPATTAPTNDTDTHGTPWADPVLLVLGMGFFFLGVLSVGMMLLPPLLFAEDTFGLQQATVVETQEKISITVGLMSVCSGASMVFFMYAGYLWLMKQGWNDVSVIALGGSITTVILTIMPFAKEIWQVAVLFALQGAGQGIFIGAMMSMPNAYLTKIWPKKMAQGRAVYNQFRAIGMLLSPLALTSAYERTGIKSAFFLVGASCAAMMLSISLFAYMQKKALDKLDSKLRARAQGGEALSDRPVGLSAEERSKLLAEGALSKEKFLKLLTARVGSKLERRNYFAVPKNVEAQYLIDELIDRALPQLPMWEEDDDGEKHLEGIARLYLSLNMPGRMHSLEERHSLDLSSLHGMMLESILDGGSHSSMQNMMQAPLPRMFVRTDSDSSITSVSSNSSINISSIGPDGKIVQSKR